MNVRPATAKDAAAIAEVFLAAGRESWGVAGEAPAEMEPPRLSGGELVAEDEDGIVGFVLIEGCSIELLATHPRVWGRGDARALLVAAEAALREAGCGEVTLWTEERNATARRVYQASGWRKEKELRERVWNGAPMRELRYRKRL
jgi:GNAT superfamily N-acetyltransferase